MNLLRSAFASIASQCYVALLALLLAPVYLRLLGTEAFGLIALSISLQAIALLLDFGLTATLSRASALHRAGELAARELAELWVSARTIYLGVSVLVLALGAASLILFPSRWTGGEQLTHDEVRSSLSLMLVIIVLRWWSDLYRGVLAGFERFVWLSAFNAGLATARLAVVIPFFVWSTAGIVDFFLLQLMFAMAEFAVLARTTQKILPDRNLAVRGGTWFPLRNVYPFMVSMAMVTGCWVLVSQSDKILLASLVPLREYGELTLATLAASSVVLVTMPLSAVILPRLTTFVSASESTAFAVLYRNATQWLGLLAWPIAAILTVHAQTILVLWTGDMVLASKAAPVLQLYAIGNAILAVSAIAYLGQFARGMLRHHVVGSVLFLVLLFPLLDWSTKKFGVIGAAWTWLSLNLAYLVLWVWIVHKVHGPASHVRWLTFDVGRLAALAFIAATIGASLPSPEHKLLLALQIAGLGLLTVAFTSLGSSWALRILREGGSAFIAMHLENKTRRGSTRSRE